MHCAQLDDPDISIGGMFNLGGGTTWREVLAPY